MTACGQSLSGRAVAARCHRLRECLPLLLLPLLQKTGNTPLMTHKYSFNTFQNLYLVLEYVFFRFPFQKFDGLNASYLFFFLSPHLKFIPFQTHFIGVSLFYDFPKDASKLIIRAFFGDPLTPVLCFRKKPRRLIGLKRYLHCVLCTSPRCP